MNPTLRSVVVVLLAVAFLAPIGWSIGRGIAPASDNSGRLGAEVAVAGGFVALGYWVYRSRRPG